MKKLLCLVLSLMFLPVLSASAAQDLTQYAIANATVQAAAHIDVVAPYSGTLEVFDLSAGDEIQAGDTLMTLQTTTLYATENGKVSTIFAEPGDDASALNQRYGGVMGIEPAVLYQLQCTTSDAYDKKENKTLHLGETLFFHYGKKEDEVEGTGRVVAVNNNSYVVDILTGEFEVSETLSLYRDDDYASRDCVGKGSVVRRSDVLPAGMGRVAEIFVKEGDPVRAGQPLATLMAPDADPDAKPVITAQQSGVVSAVQVMPGQQVWKGQTLCRIELTQDLEVVAEVDEMDLGSLQAGDKVYITIDMLGEETITGTVAEISSLGVTRQNAAYYTVHVSISEDSVPLGASASVYLPKESYR